MRSFFLHSDCSIEKSEHDAQCRLWIYSHHIYSSKKRRTIGNLAHQLNLSGFCRPGKPGESIVQCACLSLFANVLLLYSCAAQFSVSAVSLSPRFSLPFAGFICVEGTESDCSHFWLKCRSENWQRISLIERSFPVEEKLFNSFNEIVMSQSDFFKFLKDVKCDSLIRTYLGI